MTLVDSGFPDASLAFLSKKGRKTMYQTPDGFMNRCTTILDALPKQRFLTDWAARIEREAVVFAATQVFGEGFEGGPVQFAEAVEARLGPAREHQKALEKGGELGTFAHQEIQRQTHEMLGLSVGPPVDMPSESQLAVMAWREWYDESGLKPLRCEQVVWDAISKVAGTIDNLSMNADGHLIVLDYKTSKGIYDEHHVQVAKYVQMARNFGYVEGALIVRLPKTLDDRLLTTNVLGSKPIEVKELGDLYDRTLTLEQLLRVFDSAQAVYELMIQKQEQ